MTKKPKKNLDYENELVESFFNKLNKDHKKLNDEETKTIIKFMVNELKDVPINIRYFYLETLVNKSQIFDDISAEFFVRIIRHLRVLGEQKREKHSIGVNIVVFPDENTAGRVGTNSAIPFDSKTIKVPTDIDYNSFFKNNYDLERAYRYINPDNSFFAYQYSKNTDKARFIGIKDFSTNNGNLEIVSTNDGVFEKMSFLSSNNSIGFSLQGDKSYIRIYQGGNHIIDYALNESSGSWAARFTSNITNLIKKSRLSNDDIILLTKYIIQLAYNASGALIVITSDYDNLFNNEDNGININVALRESAMRKNFTSYASIDGAVIIERRQNGFAQVKKCGVILSPNVTPSSKYLELIHNTSSGSRHEKAASYACEHPKDFVIVVSENRTISILQGEKIIYWRDELIDTAISKKEGD